MEILNTRRQIVSLILLQLFCFSFFTVTVSGAAETVKLQLKWKHQFQFAGYYAAIEQGYYAEEGLDVILIEGKPGGDEVEEVLSGRADIGVGMADILLARLKGKPVVVLANIFQHSPVILLTMKESGYTSPHKLFHRKIRMATGEKSAELQAMFINEGVSLDKITVTQPSWNLDDLIKGEVDGVAAYISSQPYQLKIRNVPYTVISPETYGIDFYGDNLFTTESEIARHPTRVASFRNASLKGWQYALENPEEIIDLILSKYKGDNKNLTREFLRNEADEYQKLILPEFVAIGYMNPGRWKHIADTYVKLGMADERYSLDGLLFDPSPTRFDWNHWAVKWGIGAIILGFGSTLFFMFFNGRLKREIYERKQTEKALRESEERFKVLYEYAPLPYQSLDVNGCFVEVNQTWLEVSGYRKNEVIGKSFAEFLHPDWIDHFKENFPKFKSIGEILGVEFQLRKKDGEYLWITFDGKIRRDSVGAFIQTHCVFSDITEQKQLNKKLKEQELIIHKTQRMEAIGTLAGGIAHDFNNILAAIMGYAEFIQEDVPKESRTGKNIAEILAAGKRATDLVRQILTISRQEISEKQVIQPHLFVKEALKMLRATLPTTVTIQEHIDPDCGRIIADPTIIHQIVVNLCTNGLQAMADQKGILHVELQRRQLNAAAEVNRRENVSPGPFVVLTVRDNGCGMDQQIIDRIFEPYFTTKEVGRGTGLGLAIIHGAMEEYKGFIEVESSVGMGTIFSVYFPLTDEPVTQVVALEKKDVEDIVPGDIRILVVDDELLLAKLNETRLKNRGYQVTMVSDSRKALETFRGRPEAFDVLITDQTMPGLTGADLTKAVLEIKPSLPIIMCTGHSDIVSKEEAIGMGIKKYVYKPIHGEELLDAVLEVLGKN